MSGTNAEDAKPDMATKPSAMLAGLRGTYWNAQRAAWVSVYDGNRAGNDTEDGRWTVVCERHGSLLSVDTLKLAHEDARSDPAEFCEECRDEVGGTGDYCTRESGAGDACQCVDCRADDKPAPTDPDNAAERIAAGALIAELAGADYVTTTEAAAVIAWCQEWARDTFEDYPEHWTHAAILRRCHLLIEGGLGFVLADVQRVANDARQGYCAACMQDDHCGACDCCESEEIPTIGNVPVNDYSAEGISTMREHLAILSDGTLDVTREHSGTEDGPLWYVMRNGTRTERGGCLYESDALREAIMATRDKTACTDASADCRKPGCIHTLDTEPEHETRPAPWADLPQSTRDGYAARWAREAYAGDAPELVTDAQALTLVALAESVGESWQCPPSVSVAQYGTNGDVLAVLTMDGPAPNHIVALWAGGDCYIVRAERDWDVHAPKLREQYGRVVSQREGDAVYVITPGGTYKPAPKLG